MESKCPVQKRIAVAGGDGRETVLLNRILRCCGRSNYSVADVRSSLPSGTQPAVLLAVKALSVRGIIRYALRNTRPPVSPLFRGTRIL